MERARSRRRTTAPTLAWPFFVVLGTTIGCELVIGSEERPLANDAGAVDASAPDTGPSDASGPDASFDAPDSPDAVADTSPPDPGISCGLAYCPAGTPCCVGRCTAGAYCGAPSDAGGFYCRSVVGENCGWNQYFCDDTADCDIASAPAGSVCCGIAESAQCIRLLDCQAQQAHVIYCDPYAAAPCPNGATCTVVDGGRPRCAGL